MTSEKTKPVPMRAEIEALKGDMQGIKSQSEQAFAMLKEISKAINNPVQISRRDETGDHEIGNEKPRVMSSTGDARESLQPRVLEQVEGVTMSKMEALAFMEEEIVVVVADTTNPHDVAVPVVWNDGRAQYFFRNSKSKVKRKYVEVLGRLKKTTFSQRLIKDGNGNDTYENVPHTALMYPFSVVYDPSGKKGNDWLEKLLKERQ
jgi:hypothetical protein